jgi:hypothetical protein
MKVPWYLLYTWYPWFLLKEGSWGTLVPQEN